MNSTSLFGTPPSSPGLLSPISTPFSCLPAELRQMIWLNCLDRRPRVYTFDLAGRDENGMRWDNDDSLENLTSVHPVFEIYFTEEPNLISGSADRRMLGGICMESRAVVLKVFPDILCFELCGEEGVDFDQDADEMDERLLKRLGFCRYNGALDVISLRAVRDHLYLFPKVMARRLEPFPEFRAIQNLALIYEMDDENVLSLEHTEYPNDAPHNPDVCACLDGLRFTSCREDMFPRFMACFPSLKKVIINDVSSRPCEYYWEESQVMRFTGCTCSESPIDGPPSFTPSRKHELWRLVPLHNHQSHRQESECIAVVYDEETDCAGMNLGPLKVWDTIDTSYEPPQHLVMRFLHPKDAQGRWAQPHRSVTPATPK